MYHVYKEPFTIRTPKHKELVYKKCTPKYKGLKYNMYTNVQGLVYVCAHVHKELVYRMYPCIRIRSWCTISIHGHKVLVYRMYTCV